MTRARSRSGLAVISVASEGHPKTEKVEGTQISQISQKQQRSGNPFLKGRCRSLVSGISAVSVLSGAFFAVRRYDLHSAERSRSAREQRARLQIDPERERARALFVVRSANNKHKKSPAMSARRTLR